MHRHQIDKYMKFIKILMFSFMMSPALMAQHSLISPDSLQKKCIKEQTALRDSFNNYFYPQFQKLFALPENSFTAIVDSGRAVFLQNLDEYAKDLNPAFISRQKEGTRFFFDQLLAYYPDIHGIYYGINNPTTTRIEERLKKNLPDFNRPELLNISEFTDYAKSYLDFRIRREVDRGMYQHENNRWLKAAWQLFTVLISNDSCRNFWRYTYLQDHIDNSGIKNIEAIYKDFKSTCSDTANLHKIVNMYTDDSIGRTGHLIRPYKTVGSIKLDMHIFLPDKTNFQGPRPVIVFFHGGSWSDGKPDWFFYPCLDYTKKGWVACAVEYRVYNQVGTTPFESVKDARSAIRWLRQNAGEYGIDTGRIVASGNSAGGHMVLCSALADRYNEKTDNLAYSPVPNILLVNSGVFDLTPPSWYSKNAEDSNHVKQISPVYLVRKGMPPTLIIHGTEDGNVPYATALTFDRAMKLAGNEYEFRSIQGASHFIWYDQRYWPQVEQIRSAFLKKYGY